MQHRNRPQKQFTLDNHTIELLEAYCKEEDKAQSKVVDRAIVEYITRKVKGQC